MIRHLLHSEIDKQRWDSCVERSINRLPYAYSWWLDAVCDGWDALVEDDYKSVMPLTRKKKLGIDYLYQPFFTQQLGVYSVGQLNHAVIDSFLSSIPETYRYIDIQLNSANNPVGREFQHTVRKNYTLDLSPSYEQLAAGYHRNCSRNIRKAVHAGLMVKPGPGPTVFTQFIRRNLEKKILASGRKFYPVLYQITSASIQNNTGEILGVYKPGGELLAAGWFVNAAGRYTFLVCASIPAGKTNQAMFLLVDHAIRKNSGRGLIFDFAGSNIPGIAYFNQGFGAKQGFYPALKRNLLPWPLRLIKN